MDDSADHPTMRPLCFVLMPFGRKRDANGEPADFDAVYTELIRPAVIQAELDPIRADEEKVGGVIHDHMFQRLILCDYAVADLTTANANVFYELGIRHAVRPRSTVMVFGEKTPIPFDLGPVRGIPYRLDPEGRPVETARAHAALVAALVEARRSAVDSPVFQLIGGMKPPEIGHLEMELFRDRVRHSTGLKDRLARARDEGVRLLEAAGRRAPTGADPTLADARGQAAGLVTSVRRELGKLQDEDPGVLVDLLLAYRDVGAWEEMIALVGELPEHVRRALLVREQHALALNRVGRGEEAERVLLDVLAQQGSSSETCGLLGRVYKDRWEAASRTASSGAVARGALRKAIEMYLKGFEADWRDAYPGVNAVELMELQEPPDPRREVLLPVVTYSARRRIATGNPGYWDWATLLELAVLASDESAAAEALENALAAKPEPWKRASTAESLRRIREARARRGRAPEWLGELELALGAGG